MQVDAVADRQAWDLWGTKIPAAPDAADLHGLARP